MRRFLEYDNNSSRKNYLKSVSIQVFLVCIFPHSKWSIQYECGKIRTRKTPNTDTFYVVEIYWFLSDVLQTVCDIPIGKDPNAYLEPRQTSLLEPFYKSS